MSAGSSYFSNDTIFALTTPLGGAVAGVRLSGSKSREILAKISKNTTEIPERKAVRRDLFSSQGRKIDDALVVCFENPRSYTGEDVVELWLHGSPAIAESLAQEFLSLGLRQALPGEFSFRAVKNGKLSLSQAEAVQELVAATNSEAVDLALEKLDGSHRALILAFADEMRKLASLSELGIDFSDQDVDEVSLKNLKRECQVLIRKLEDLKSSFARGKRIQDGIGVCLFGRPNAGKSTLFNILVNEERSIVSSIAGTTRDVVRETMTLSDGSGRSLSFRFHDTAGVRETEDEIEKMGVERTLLGARDADLILVLVDPLDPEGFPELMAAFSCLERKSGSEVIFVLTKQDQISMDDQVNWVERVSGMVGIPSSVIFSGKTRYGLDELVRRLLDIGFLLTQRKSGEVLLTRWDHVRAVEQAITHLERSLTTVSEDLFAADIRQSLISLGPLIGETPTDDILGRIFSEFCIGK